jgi:hypothetical protein
MTGIPSRPMVFIATPCFGGLVSQHYMQSVIRLIQFASQANFDAALALLGHDSLITRSRNTLVSQFLNTPEATHLLFVDADICFEAEQVYEMLSFDQPRRSFTSARSAPKTSANAKDASRPPSIAAAASCS